MKHETHVQRICTSEFEAKIATKFGQHHTHQFTVSKSVIIFSLEINLACVYNFNSLQSTITLLASNDAAVMLNSILSQNKVISFDFMLCFIYILTLNSGI